MRPRTPKVDALGIRRFRAAVLGAIRWLFVIPAAPILSVVVIALCVMVIYGLAVSSGYCETA